MRKPMILVALILAAIHILPALAHADNPEKLLKVVALSRHGVRAPTQSDKVLAMWSKKTWPVWPVPKGDLTPRGASLVSAMWGNLGDSLTRQGLLPENSCPAQSLVHVRADTDERTKATAKALLDGLAPDCKLAYSISGEKVDPLFHPVKAGLYQFQALPAVMDVLSMTKGGLADLQETFSGALNLLDAIAGPPAAEICSRFVHRSDCQISDLSNAVSVTPDGSDVKLVGSLAIASSMAEIFLLEYAEWPDVSAGWGQVNSSTLSQLLPVHSKIFDVVNRSHTVAWAQGSSLLAAMGAALQGKHADPALNEAKLVVFVGHDTNIANIGSLLNANWQASGYPENGIPPASLFAMELWNNRGKEEVRLRFYVQPIRALHSMLPSGDWKSPMLAEFAPTQNPVNVPPIVGEARFTPQEFDRMISNAIKGAPLAPQEKTSLDYAMPAISR